MSKKPTKKLTLAYLDKHVKALLAEHKRRVVVTNRAPWHNHRVRFTKLADALEANLSGDFDKQERPFSKAWKVAEYEVVWTVEKTVKGPL